MPLASLLHISRRSKWGLVLTALAIVNALMHYRFFGPLGAMLLLPIEFVLVAFGFMVVALSRGRSKGRSHSD